MARSEIPMVINLRQNTNDDSTAFGKWFAEIDSKEPLNLKGLAKHMTEHGKISSLEMCQLVLGEMVKCLVHLLREGQPVKLDGFGTFTPVIENDGKVATSTVEGTLEVGLENLIEVVHLRFTPENTTGEKLTSRALKEECTFKGAYVIESKKKTIDGKQVTYQEKIPLSSSAVATHTDPEP